MRLGTKNFYAGRLAGGLGLMLAGAMLSGCMSADKRPNTTTTQQKTAKANTNTNSQSNANNSSATGGNANAVANQNNGNVIPATNTSGSNATNNNAANGTNNTVNGTASNSPLGRPTGLNAGSTYNPIPNNNMNSPPQFGGSLQPISGNAPANSNGLLPIASSASTPNRGNPPIQNLNGPAAGPGGLPPLDAVPSVTPSTSQRPAPPAVSMQNNDRMLNFPPSAPLPPTPTINPGPVNVAPVNPAPINALPINGNPAGPIAPLPTGGN